VLLPKISFQGGIKFRRGLDDEWNLPIYMHVALPAVNRLAGCEDIHTGRESRFHQISGQFAGSLCIWQCGEYETDSGHGESA